MGEAEPAGDGKAEAQAGGEFDVLALSLAAAEALVVFGEAVVGPFVPAVDVVEHARVGQLDADVRDAVGVGEGSAVGDQVGRVQPLGGEHELQLAGEHGVGDELVDRVAAAGAHGGQALHGGGTGVERINSVSARRASTRCCRVLSWASSKPRLNIRRCRMSPGGMTSGVPTLAAGVSGGSSTTRRPS